jgi:hypothetical protein
VKKTAAVQREPRGTGGRRCQQKYSPWGRKANRQKGSELDLAGLVGTCSSSGVALRSTEGWTQNLKATEVTCLSPVNILKIATPSSCNAEMFSKRHW